MDFKTVSVNLNVRIVEQEMLCYLNIFLKSKMRDILKREEHETLLPKIDPKKKTRQKAAGGGKSIRVKTVPGSHVQHLPGT